MAADKRHVGFRFVVTGVARVRGSMRHMRRGSRHGQGIAIDLVPNRESGRRRATTRLARPEGFEPPTTWFEAEPSPSWTPLDSNKLNHLVV